MGSRKVEMEWTCSACDTVNRGRDKVCASCGDPKDASEKFVMPKGKAPTVTDPALLKKATAGADWRCEACGSNQSALVEDCTQCGSPRNGAPAIAKQKPKSKTGSALPGIGWVLGPVGLFVGGVGAVGTGIVGVVGFFAWQERDRDVTAVVAEHHWARTVSVERFALRDFDGFAETRPEDAIGVKSLGQKHHHDEQVLDHYRTEYYTEEVLDGYDTRTYTAQVACGEDCTYSEPICHEECEDDENGFATCHDVCSGGGQDCETRYCDEQRSEQVPRYRTEQRSREVPEYRAEPRYQEAFAWKAWRWSFDRELKEEGIGLDARWPDPALLKLDQGLAEGEDERDSRSESYTVVLTAALDDQPLRFELAGLDEAAWRAYLPASTHVVRVSSRGEMIAVDPP